jgi:hypothetical protein
MTGVFVVRCIGRHTTKTCPHCFCRPAISTFILLCVVIDASQRVFAVRVKKCAQQRFFAVKNSAVRFVTFLVRPKHTANLGFP